MRAAGTFKVTSFNGAEIALPEPQIATALPAGVATLEKQFDGAVSGRSTTFFTAAFDQEKGVGSYVAMESFEGVLDGVSGTFNFAHAATTSGSDRTHEYFLIVPSSGTGDLAGIRGTGGLTNEHEIWFEYELG